MAQRSARREARSRAEADAGHRKRALLPLPARKPQTSIRHIAWQTIRATRGPPKGRSGCRAPQEGAASASRTKDPNEHSPYRIANDSCKTRGPPKGRSGCRAPQEGAASASRTRDPTSIRHIAWQTNRAARAPSPRDRQCSAAAHKRITTVILLPYHKQQTARRRPAPGCLLFFPLYKTELNQYNKVRSIKHRRRPS